MPKSSSGRSSFSHIVSLLLLAALLVSRPSSVENSFCGNTTAHGQVVTHLQL